MQSYQRHLLHRLQTHFSTYKQAIVLLGARQTGKTTLIKHAFPDALYLLVDNEQTKSVLDSYDISTYRQIIGATSQLVIDELHLLQDPGRAVKILYDQVPGLQLIVTGSSALHIKNKSTESLAGRKITYHLFPLSFSEYLVQKGYESDLSHSILENILQPTAPKQRLFVPADVLEHLLLYGLYPEATDVTDPRTYLLNLADSAVFKDIVELNLIENRTKAKELLQLLAHQIGNLVNYSELGATIGLDRRTVERYLDIFEQSFLIFRVFPFAKNKRRELGKTPKIYFYDLGLRNALIDSFGSTALRADGGALFENFLMAELLKSISYQNVGYKLWYWRLKSGQEVDVVLETPDQLYAIEIKRTGGSLSLAFSNRYPKAVGRVVTRANFY